VRKYKLTVPPEAARLLSACEPIPWEKFVNDKNKDRCSAEAFDLLSQMLVYDKNLRITPANAMKHPFFAPIRQLLE
jgi:casein kinase II subunit alpha